MCILELLRASGQPHVCGWEEDMESQRAPKKSDRDGSTCGARTRPDIADRPPPPPERHLGYYEKGPPKSRVV